LALVISSTNFRIDGSLFKRSPFKDAEANPEPPQLDFSDRLRLTVGFLWFHHRIIIALILLGGLGFWINRVSTIPRHPADASIPKQSDPIELPPVELPQASLEFAPENRSSGTSDSATGPNPNDSAAPPDHETLLKTGSASELIDASLNIRANMGQRSSVVNFMMCSKRARIARRLMEIDLSPTQGVFALVSYIESISMMDSLNVQGELNMDGPRTALLEVGKKYSNHPDANVRSKANLAMVLAPAYDFLTTGDDELLIQFQREFDSRIDNIIVNRQDARTLLTTVVMANDKPDHESKTWPVALHVLRRYEQSEQPEIKAYAAGFREQLYFGKLNLNSLAERIAANRSGAHEDCQKLFAALAINPDSRLEIYSIAITAIQKYQDSGRQSEVEPFINQLKETCGKIADNELRASVLEAMDELEK
jgi:hypothetical protein